MFLPQPVFPALVRAVLATDDYAEARALSRAATDPPRAPSAQAFRLGPITSIDFLKRERPMRLFREILPAGCSGPAWEIAHAADCLQ